MECLVCAIQSVLVHVCGREIAVSGCGRVLRGGHPLQTQVEDPEDEQAVGARTSEASSSERQAFALVPSEGAGRARTAVEKLPLVAAEKSACARSQASSSVAAVRFAFVSPVECRKSVSA